MASRVEAFQVSSACDKLLAREGTLSTLLAGEHHTTDERWPTAGSSIGDACSRVLHLNLYGSATVSVNTI